MIDLNVLLDVVQRREPFYTASAATLSRILARKSIGCIPGHALTTLYYLVARQAGKRRAEEVVDWLLVHFEVVPQGRSQFLRARTLDCSDFEDAVVASAAEASGCEIIITRNIGDFAGAPIPAVTPEEFLVRE
jgi:predicted nucleic acid-binding protein